MPPTSPSCGTRTASVASPTAPGCHGSDTLSGVQTIAFTRWPVLRAGGPHRAVRDQLRRRLIEGTASANRLFGLLGDDNLHGGPGDDTINGGGGFDTAHFDGLRSAYAILRNDDGTLTVDGSTEADGIDLLASVERLRFSDSDAVVGWEAQRHPDRGADRRPAAGRRGRRRAERRPGADLLEGEDGADTLNGQIGDDTLAGGLGDDTAQLLLLRRRRLRQPAGRRHQHRRRRRGRRADRCRAAIGSASADGLTGNGGANTLEGGDGNDTLAGGAGGDVLTGGSGTDYASYAASAEGVNVNVRTGVVSGGDAEGDVLSAIENATGSESSDTLTGSNSANTLAGGGGGDVIDGWNGDDSLNGGAGADTLVGNVGIDAINGGDGGDTASYFTSLAAVSVSLAVGALNTGGDAAGDLLSNVEHLIGSSGFDDTLAGDGAANQLDGSGGNDILIGGVGADTLTGGTGTDTISYAASVLGVNVNVRTGVVSGGDAAGDVLATVENVIGSGAADTITGSNALNTMVGGNGNDLLDGWNADDNLDGGIGNDTLIGNVGADVLTGGAGNDTASYASSSAAVNVNVRTNVVSGGDAAGDTLLTIENATGSGFNDTLTGSNSANTLIGGAGADLVDGWNGDDALEGGTGNDTLIGNVGVDVLTGGDDADTFRFVTAADSTATVFDLITDLATGDVIDVAGVDANGGLAGNGTFTSSRAYRRRGPGHLVVQLGHGAHQLPRRHQRRRRGGLRDHRQRRPHSFTGFVL